MDMGEFVRSALGNLPELLTPQDLNLETNRPSANRYGSIVLPRGGTSRVAPEPSALSAPGPLIAAEGVPRHLKLFQVLSPRLAYRGRVFGSKLALKAEWETLDTSFFDAPGNCMEGGENVEAGKGG